MTRTTLLRSTWLLTMMMAMGAWAQAPLLLGYQGRLLKTDGTAETGAVQVKFSFYPTDTGGTSAWDETQSLTLVDGYYGTYIGRVTTLSTTLFDTTTQWLEIAIKTSTDNDFKPMTPRQRVGSVGYALMSRSVKGGTVDATSVSVNGSQVIDSSGHLTATAGYVAGNGIAIDSTTRAISLNVSGCSSGQVLQYNGSNFACAALTGGGGGTVTSVSAGTGLLGGNITTSGSLSVNFGTAAGTVAAGNDARFGDAAKLQGTPVLASTPATGSVLTFDGTNWAPATPAATGVTSVATGSGLTGGPITSTGTIALATGGVATTHLADGAVTAAKLAQNGCTSGQVMKWNGTAWVCGSVSAAAAPSNGDVIAAFEFEDQTGTTLTDSSGLGNNATFTSGIALGSVGHTGSSASFSGGMASVAAGNTLPDTSQLQIEAWVRPTQDATSATRVIATKPGVWSFRLVGGNTYEVEFSITSNDGQTCTVTSSGAQLPTNTFSMVLGWYDGMSLAVGVGGAGWPVGGQVMARTRCELGLLKQVPGGLINMGSASAGVNQYLGFLDSLRIRSFAKLPDSESFVNNPFPGSTILSSTAQEMMLNGWANQQYSTWRVCYRKSRDGASSTTFHSSCNFRGPSFTFMKLANGKVIGGYTGASWTSNGEYSWYGGPGFIFSLTLNKRYFAMASNSNAQLTYNNVNYGPTFGSGHDIYINSSMDLGYVNFPYSYNCNGSSSAAPSDVCSQELAGYNHNSGGGTISELETWVLADQ
jgi:hypothetical protein